MFSLPTNPHILFIGAHPDDIELGCGATIHRCIREYGADSVTCFTLSKSNAAYPVGCDEHKRAVALLGVRRYEHADFTDCRFEMYRIGVLCSLESLRRAVLPDLVFTHSERDDHQDHQTVFRECRRAFRNVNLLQYSSLYSLSLRPNYLVEVTEEDVAAKLCALSQYAQYQQKPYFDRDLVRSTMVHYGGLAGCCYAEGFTVDRFVQLSKRE